MARPQQESCLTKDVSEEEGVNAPSQRKNCIFLHADKLQYPPVLAHRQSPPDAESVCCALALRAACAFGYDSKRRDSFVFALKRRARRIRVAWLRPNGRRAVALAVG